MATDPCHYCSCAGDMSICDQLAEEKAAPDVSDPYGWESSRAEDREYGRG